MQRASHSLQRARNERTGVTPLAVRLYDPAHTSAGHLAKDLAKNLAGLFAEHVPAHSWTVAAYRAAPKLPNA